MTTYQSYFSPATLSVDPMAPRDFFDRDDIERDSGDSKNLDERILDVPLDATSDTFGTSKSAEWVDFGVRDRMPSTSATQPPPPVAFGVSPHQQQQQHPSTLVFRTPPESWGSGSCTPTPVLDAFPTSYDGVASTGYWSTSVAAPGSAGAGGRTTFELQGHGQSDSGPMSAFSMPLSTDGSMPTSPLGEWSTTGAVGEGMDLRSMQARPHPGSPLSPHSPLLLRRDGIRKKNARFEIPAERNLLNIDRLIAQSSDEREIKELKQQKRLLRNRQAALDSRQRKKQHTERLEEEKKQYTNIIADLEEACAQLRIRESEHLRREEEFKATQQRYEHYIEALHLDKEEMIRAHTLETGDLRKKNAYLTEHLQKMEGTTMSAMPSSSGFSADFSDAGHGMSGMESAGGTSWEPYPFMHDFAVEPEVHPEASSMALVSTKTESMSRRTPQQGDAADEKPTASGLLLLLLLCGAFVASKSSTTSTPTIPRLPEDVRQASATVLDNIFRDAGVSRGANNGKGMMMEGVVDSRTTTTTSSGLANAWPTATTNQNMIGLTPSSLDVLQQQLLQPTPSQEQEQVFGLTPDQYNNVVAPHSYYQGELGPSPSDIPIGASSSGIAQGRRDLGAGLAAMRDRDRQQRGGGGKNAESAAEVYTRSLLWDKVPAEVVREFARFVMANGGGDKTGSGSGSGSAASGDTVLAVDGVQQQQPLQRQQQLPQQQQQPKMETSSG
ncbi:MAG: hypothetical protein M1823_001914 [Watsoniomyces obsoletus]|nr:MAG: hypothetical protein M1823_001914 [Watsoniomyces obsoletus]